MKARITLSCFLWLLLNVPFVCIADPQPAPASKALPADEASRQPTTQSIGELLIKLGHDDAPVRDAAQAQLQKLGPSILPELKQFIKVPSNLEAAERAKAIVAGLDNARDSGPTLITLHLQNVLASEAFKAIAKQANISFLPDGAEQDRIAQEHRVTIECEGEPLWSVLQKICPQVSLKIASSRFAGPIVLSRTLSTEIPAPFAVAGPFVFLIKRIEHTRATDFAGPVDLNASPGCRMSLFVWAEPKLEATNWDTSSCDQWMTDIEEKPKVGWWANGYVNSARESRIVLQPGGDLNAAKMIKSLKMTAHFTITGRTETWKVDNPLQAHHVEKWVDGYRFVVKEVNKIVDGRYAYAVVVTPEGHNAADFLSLCEVLDRRPPVLSDAQHTSLQRMGGSSGRSQKEYTASNEFSCQQGPGQQIGEPTTLEWQLPDKVRSLMQPVEFTNLPLP
jgi:hypothetical protein